LGINLSTPPDALHAILLGHGNLLLNVCARFGKEQEEKNKKDDGEEEEEQDSEDEDEKWQHEKRRVFLENCRFWKLVLQLKYYRTRTHFHSGYLSKAGNGDDNTNGKSKLMR